MRKLFLILNLISIYGASVAQSPEQVKYSGFHVSTIENESGVCISFQGDIQSYVLNCEDYLAGYFSILACHSGKEILRFMEDDRITFGVERDSIIFKYHVICYNPATDSYDFDQTYRTIAIGKENSGEAAINERYQFMAPPLTEEQIISFVITLDSIFTYDDLLLEKANGYGFNDMLFYCSLAGNPKATYYFENYEKILLEQKQLSSQYGGEPAQIYRLNHEIYVKLKQQRK